MPNWQSLSNANRVLGGFISTYVFRASPQAHRLISEFFFEREENVGPLTHCATDRHSLSRIAWVILSQTYVFRASPQAHRLIRKFFQMRGECCSTIPLCHILTFTLQNCYGGLYPRPMYSEPAHRPTEQVAENFPNERGMLVH